MASYSIIICRRAEKEIISAPKPDRQRIVARIRKLSANPRPHGSEKLKGNTSYWIRQGDWRIVYTVSDKDRVISIDKVGHRREVYR
ncbi:MAG: type II toxin-antitoxin system RelE/ParE family toxin [Pseudomonadota bacterium]